MTVSGPAAPTSRTPRNPISRRQVERVLSRSVAVFGIVFGAQTVPWLLGQLDEADPVWLWTSVAVLFGSLVVVAVLAFANRWVRRSQGFFALAYLAALATWPFFLLPGAEIFPGIHWLYYLMTVATSMATIAFPTFSATVYLFTAPLIYLAVRATPAGGSATLGLATLEAVYSIFLGGAVLIIITMLRQASSSVDGAQATALDRYGHAVRQHATEVERVQVDAIVHDSVLTTLLSAARARTPEAKALAATMAGNAIGHLRDAAAASPDDGTTVRLTTLAARIEDAARELSTPIEVRSKSLGTTSLPTTAAESLYSAAVQAMVNSLAHAGEGVDRWVAIRGVRPGGIEIIVGDTGVGFDLGAVPGERLGVRVSIIERLANAGGRAVIQAAAGEGTIVTLRWPHAAPAAEPSERVEVSA
ncbi:MAG TPA: ATP-binding protein [Rhodoglobus sp.]|nr:ATP-binding protein [Rhodoglobus sp.]